MKMHPNHAAIKRRAKLFRLSAHGAAIELLREAFKTERADRIASVLKNARSYVGVNSLHDAWCHRCIYEEERNAERLSSFKIKWALLNEEKVAW